GLLGAQIAEDARIARVLGVRVATAECGDDLLYVRQLVCAFDPGMRGEDLLEQGRARPRQTDDEDRIRLGSSPVLAAGKDVRGATGNLLLGVALDDLRSVAARRSLERIADFVVAVRLLVRPFVLEGLAQRETDMEAVFGRKPAIRLERTQPLQLLGREA